MNWFKRLFCKEETRVLSWDDSKKNAILANCLGRAVANGDLKEYKNVMAFIEKHQRDDVSSFAISSELTTPEITSLKTKWVVLQYKCQNSELDEYMKN